MNFPIVLFDINAKQIKNHDVIVNSHSFYFYSYQNFSVEIIEGNGTLYSVVEKTITDNTGVPMKTLETSNGQKLSNNFGYTLFIPENLTSVKLILINNFGESEIYNFTLRLDNVLTEEQEHYHDLLINYYLPTFEELEPCLVPGAVKSDLIKRLLLDFRGILQSKGTTKSIEKFFEFIGMVDEQFKIFEEFRRPNKTLTISPDKTQDTKTGNYHVAYNNWNDGNQNGKQDVNRKNMPYRPFAQQNLEEFLDCLKYAIPIANKYFTCVEQDITFFGISHSVNIPMYQSNTMLMNQIFDHDICSFRKFLHIDLFYNYSTTKKEKLPLYLVKNCIQKEKECFCSEVKHYSAEHDLIFNELHFIDYEIHDGEDFIESNIKDFSRDFGAILHLNIKVQPNTFIKVTVKNKTLDLIQIIYPKTLITTDEIELQWCTTKNAKYDVIVEATNLWNCVETYFYEYEMKYDSRLLDIDIFTSANVDDANMEINNINTDFDSGSVTYFANTALRNYILPFDILDRLGEDLRRYWIITPAQLMKYLSETVMNKTTKLNILPEINKNLKVVKVTDTIPVVHSCQTLDFIVLPYNDGDYLTITTYNPIGEIETKIEIEQIPTGEQFIKDGVITDVTIETEVEKKYINHYITERLTQSATSEKAFHYDEVFNKLYVRIMNITEEQEDCSEIQKKYFFITPIETGIDLTVKTYDLRLRNLYSTDEISIYEHPEKILYQLPINYDFPLFPISGSEFIFSTIKNNYPIVKSIIPRLINYKNTVEVLKLADIIIARINQDLICDESNVQWIIEDAFTHETLYSSNDYMLKYRTDENTVYNIIFKCNINGEYIEIIKEGVITSYKTI